MEPLLQIGSMFYEKTNGVFEVGWDHLGPLRFADVPYYSTVDVGGLPGNPDTYELAISATHGGGPDNEDFMLSIHVQFRHEGNALDPIVRRACDRKASRIRRTFAQLVHERGLDDAEGGNDHRTYFNGAWYCDMLYSTTFTRNDNPLLADFLDPVVEQFRTLLETPELLLFLCHASEDKAFVDALAAFLDSRDLELWYDKREIRAGESIVERINEGLDAASHLVLVLSPASTNKPWVQREFSAALMKQLNDASITVVPVLRESCAIPMLLNDIRYVDCRLDRDAGFQQLLEGIAAI